MRVALCWLLASLLAACPILCGTGGVVLGMSCCADDNCPDDAPAPSPVNDEDCLCNGALKADTGTRLNSADRVGPTSISPHSDVGSPSQPTASIDQAGRQEGGPPPGRACARLQRFRC